MLAWASADQDGNTDGVFARRFASNGSAVNVEFRVNTYTTGGQRWASVSADADGDFVVAWQSSDQDGENYGVFAQSFNAEGNPVGAEFQVNARTASIQRFPAIGMNSFGDFVVAWQSYTAGPSNDIVAQRYDKVSVLDIDNNGDIEPLKDGIMILRFMFGFEGEAITAGAVNTGNCQRCDTPDIEEYLQSLI